MSTAEAELRKDPAKQARFDRLHSGPYFSAVVEANRAYLAAAVPDAAVTERERWVLTCLPGNAHTQRLSVLSMRTMEVLVLLEPVILGDGDVTGFVSVRQSVLKAALPPGRSLEQQYPGLSFRTDSPYHDAGEDQIRVLGPRRALVAAFADETFAAAARALATDLLTGRTSHARHHNYPLADAVLGRTVPVDPPVVDDTMRNSLLVRTCLEVLSDSGERMHGRTVLDEVAKRITLTEAELRPHKSGVPVWTIAARFHTGDAATIGWMVKRAGDWWITDAGRAALEEYPGRDEFYAEIGRRYREVYRNRKQARKKYDNRLHVLAAALQRVEPGSWTAYDDLAELVDGTPDDIAHLLADTYVENSHRVLDAAGRIPPAEHQHVRHRGSDLRARLVEESVEFTGRTANQEQRIPADLLRGELEPSPATEAVARRAWLVRGANVDGYDLVPRWLAEGWVSLAASQLTGAVEAVGPQRLAQIIEEEYRHKSYSVREKLRGYFEAFLRGIRPGDFVLTVEQGEIHLGLVDGPARFVESPDRRSNLRRDVEWLTVDAARDLTELTGSLPTLLQNQDDLIDLTDALDAVERLHADLTPEAPPAAPAPEARLAQVTEDVAAELLTELDWLTRLRDLLAERKQVILYGPPGTGKTYLATRLAAKLTEAHAVRLVQFHPSYTYEDFFEGFRPQSADDGTLRFKLTPGPLRQLADEAREHPSTAYVLVIDEINRGNLAKVFGELYFLLEYRDEAIRLQYSAEPFTLPPNLYLIGTMNTADRSIALLDAAMRRRFAFVELHPAKPPVNGLLRRWLERHGLDPSRAGLLDALNVRLDDADYAVGPSYLMRPSVHAGPDALRQVWEYDVLPLLREHHYADDVDVDKRYNLDDLLASLPSDQP
ncbi:AAA family ATPase [Micromonospora echinospora]|nr:AAA family ATPase [Micromonospora echinospora]